VTALHAFGRGVGTRVETVTWGSTQRMHTARPSCRHLRPACAVQQDKGADLITIRLCIMRTYMYTTYATHSSMHGYVREGARSIYIPVRVHSSGAWTTYGAGPDFSYRIRHCRSGSTSPCGYSIAIVVIFFKKTWSSSFGVGVDLERQIVATARTPRPFPIDRRQQLVTPGEKCSACWLV
jgi:hypothetical protein